MSDENPVPKTPEPGKPAATSTSPATPPPVDAAVKAPHKPAGLKVVLGIVILLVVIVLVALWIINSLSIASTDDAYVNSHVTFVAPRVEGQVKDVLVDDNYRVHKGDVLVRLDPEPYQVQVNIKQAAVDSAQADLVAADASVRGQQGLTRSLRFKLENSIEEVDNQIALIGANVAALNKTKATLTLAQAEFDRAQKLLAGNVTSHEEFDQRRQDLDVAKAQYAQALQNVYQSRVALGLPAEPPNGGQYTDVPGDLDQTFSSVRETESELIQAASQLGVVSSSVDMKPKDLVAEFYRRDPQGNIDRIYAQIRKDAPAIKQAEAKLESAQRDLDQAKLNLSYCDIVSEIDGVVTRRNVNPGNNVQVGQELMAIRSLTEIWVDANFKETQLAKLRIGQPVDLETDVYGKHKVYQGRISGFTMGTGSTLALLPAQNATGNFVKVVQRLPVRIEVLDYDPDKDPLFVGISVTPKVHIKEAPTGPNAGAYLQPYAALPKPDVTPGETPAVQSGTANP
jgi:membrane fusion protein, multidrug efflux system